MKNKIKESFLIKLFLSYLLVLAFALVVGMVLFQSSLSQIRQSTEKYGRFSLLQVDESICQMEKSIQVLPDTLSARDEYLSLMYADPELTNYKRERIARLHKEMTLQVAYNNYVSGMYIWFTRPQVAVATTGMIKGRENMEQMMLERFGVTLDRVDEWAEDGRFSIHLLGEGMFADKAIAVVKGSKSNTGQGTLIIMELRLSACMDILSGGKESSVDHDASFWLQSGRKGPILAPGPAHNLALAADETGQVIGEDVIRVRYEGEDLILMGKEHGKDFTIISAWDYGSYTKIQKQYQKMAILFLSAYLILGACMAVTLTRINYEPIRSLINLIMERVSEVSGGEFAILEAGINSLLHCTRDYEQARAKERKRLREKYLASLLLEDVDREEFTERCREHNLQFASDRFAVVGIAMRDSRRLFFDDKASRHRESMEIGLFAISSVAEELMNQYTSAYTCRQEGRIWAIVSPGQGEELEFPVRIREICETAEQFLREQMGIPTWFYVSELSDEIWQPSSIAAAYENALWGMEQIESYNIQRAVNDFQSVEACIRPVVQGLGDDAGAMRRQLFLAVTKGDFKEADELYLKVRSRDIEFTDNSFATVRAQSLLLTGYFVSFLPESAKKEHNGEIKEYVKQIRSERQDEQLIRKMHDWMVYFYGLYQEVEKAGVQTEERDVAAEAAAYVNGHYSDMSLSVGQIAEQTGVSSSYLARNFQKKYGMSVLQYIHNRRIETAMVLLRESSSTIEKIAEQVGYANSLALIRAFKRCKNCTPTEYRNSLGRE